MAQKITSLRVVLASPSDVKRERDAFAKVVEQVNNDTARPAGFHLDLWRWETDSHPGFNPLGPQGLIDTVLRIDRCDLFVGILWNRIGTPTAFGKTGTEHEFETAYQSWKRRMAPQIMFYFNERPSTLTSADDLAQRGKVLEFRRTFPDQGLYWPYKGAAAFAKYANQHLRKFIHDVVGRRASGKTGEPPKNRPGPIGKPPRPPGQEETFTLKINRQGSVTLPAALRKRLNLRQEDRLQLRVVDNRIVDGVGLPKKQQFEPETVSRLRTRSKDSPAGIAPSEL